MLVMCVATVLVSPAHLAQEFPQATVVHSVVPEACTDSTSSFLEEKQLVLVSVVLCLLCLTGCKQGQLYPGEETPGHV